MNAKLLEDILLRPQVVRRIRESLDRSQGIGGGFVLTLSRDNEIKLGKERRYELGWVDTLAKDYPKVYAEIMCEEEPLSPFEYSAHAWEISKKLILERINARREDFLEEFGEEAIRKAKLVVDTTWRPDITEEYASEMVGEPVNKGLFVQSSNLPRFNHLWASNSWGHYAVEKGLDRRKIVTVNGRQKKPGDISVVALNTDDGLPDVNIRDVDRIMFAKVNYPDIEDLDRFIGAYNQMYDQHNGPLDLEGRSCTLYPVKT